MIVEMAGRPAEHLIESLDKYIRILNDVKDIKVHSIKLSEPKKIELSENIPNGETMFTAFAEADFETESFARLSETMFDFMPSSVEVVEPDKIKMDMNEATNLLNNISGRLHRYDEIAKILGERYKQMEAALAAARQALAHKDAELIKSKEKPKKSVKKKASKKKKISKK